MKTFHANGKLLISGEYLVLDGALSLAIPTQKGQSLEFISSKEPLLNWKSLDENGETWFYVDFTDKLKVIDTSDQSLANKLKIILEQASTLALDNIQLKGSVTCRLEFPRLWGLGSSSTLISCISKWFNINAFELHFKVNNGSGYDIACAEHNSSIVYQLINRNPIINKIKWHPEFSKNLFFVYLKNKQNSKNEVEKFLKNRNIENANLAVKEISQITKQIIECKKLDQFSILIEKHEQILSELLNYPTIKEKLFNDYSGSIKSLGAWGGDFILATGNKVEKTYFSSKGYEVIIDFNEMLKTS